MEDNFMALTEIQMLQETERLVLVGRFVNNESLPNELPNGCHIPHSMTPCRHAFVFFKRGTFPHGLWKWKTIRPCDLTDLSLWRSVTVWICHIVLTNWDISIRSETSLGQIHQVRGSFCLSFPQTMWKSPYSNFKAWWMALGTLFHKKK